MIANNIDNGKEFDWGRASSDYKKYRDIYPEEFYERIVNLGFCVKGQKVLDLGTGTGVLPRNMYKYGAEFTGSDIAANQIEAARELSEDMDIDYIVAGADSDKFKSHYFDVVTAVQCFMYFDKETVLPNIYRVLKNDGHLLILFMSYLPLESEIANMSEKLILKYNPDWNGAGYQPKKDDTKNKINPKWCGNMFTLVDKFGYRVDIEFTRESWNGRMKACRGIGASSLAEDKISAWEREHTEYLNTQPDKFYIPHWVTGLVLKKA